MDLHEDMESETDKRKIRDKIVQLKAKIQQDN